MKIQQIRNATIIIEYAGKRFLVDPMLGGKGSFAPFPFSHHQKLRNPLHDLPMKAEDIVHNIEHIKEPHAGPEIYVEQHCAHPRPYFKPGVDTPMDVAARNFEAAMNMDGPDHHMSNGR